MNPYNVIADLEVDLCEYTAAPHCVCVSSCTIALEMVCAWLRVGEVSIPRRTYVSVPQAIVKSGGTVIFDNRDWVGSYSLNPYPIRDSAPRFMRGMYAGGYECLSFHRRKVLGHTEGGAILCCNADTARELRILRHDGREAGSPRAHTIGYHAVMSPGVAAELLAKLPYVGDGWEMRFDEDYPDLSYQDWNALYASSRARLTSEASTEMLEALRQVRALRANNNDNWMDLLEHVARSDPDYFRAWQKRTRNIDLLVSEQMRKTVECSERAATP